MHEEKPHVDLKNKTMTLTGSAQPQSANDRLVQCKHGGGMKPFVLVRFFSEKRQDTVCTSAHVEVCCSLHASD